MYISEEHICTWRTGSTYLLLTNVLKVPHGRGGSTSCMVGIRTSMAENGEDRSRRIVIRIHMWQLRRLLNWSEEENLRVTCSTNHWFEGLWDSNHLSRAPCPYTDLIAVNECLLGANGKCQKMMTSERALTSCSRFTIIVWEKAEVPWERRKLWKSLWETCVEDERDAAPKKKQWI